MRKYLLLSIMSATLMMQGCDNSNRYVQLGGYAQGGIYTVTCKTSGVDAKQLQSGIDSVLAVIDRSVSGYNPGSLLTRYNEGREPVDDGSAEYKVFSEIKDYCDSLYYATGKVLDTRSAALFDIWGFGFKEGKMPTEDEIAAALQDRSKMNFNAVAQGYSADLVGRYLKGMGVKDMLVNIGGEIYCCGVNPGGTGWTLGIDTPVDGNMNPGQNMSGKFTVESGKACGVVTSGNYRKFYIVDGVKYSHTVDPRTGRPVQHNLLSATIIAPTSALADALATYCMVVGKDEAAAMIESREDIEGCLITSDEIWCSKGLTLDR